MCEEAQCVPQEISCGSWSSRGFDGEECGDQRCTDGCKLTSYNTRKCSPYHDICTWSHINECKEGCGIETCRDINGNFYQGRTLECKEEKTVYTIKQEYTGVEYCREFTDYCGTRHTAEGPVDCKTYCPDIIGEWSDTGLEGACGTRITYNKCDNNLIRSQEEKECVLGDINSNECINFEDFFLMADCMNSEYQEKCDLNKDQSVDEKDFNILSHWMGKGICKKEEPAEKPVAIPIVIPIIEGDLDRNQCVDFDDFFMLVDNIDKEYNETLDLDKDNQVTAEDNKVIEENFGRGCEWENSTKRYLTELENKKKRGLSVSSTKAGGKREINQTRGITRKPVVVVKKDDPNMTIPLPIVEIPVEKEIVTPEEGDIDQSSCIDSGDLYLFIDCYNEKFDTKCDFNKDDAIDTTDYNVLKNNLWKGCSQVNKVNIMPEMVLESRSCKNWDGLGKDEVRHIYINQIGELIDSRENKLVVTRRNQEPVITVKANNKDRYSITHNNADCGNAYFTKNDNYSGTFTFNKCAKSSFNEKNGVYNFKNQFCEY